MSTVAIGQKHSLGWRLPAYIVMLIFTVLTLGPLLWLLYSSLKPHQAIVRNIFALPTTFHIENYVTAWERGSLGIYFINSIIYTTVATTLTTFFALSAGYALAKFRYKISGLIYAFFIMGLLFPLTVAILPLYLQLRNFGLTGSRMGVVLAEAAFQLPLSIFIFSGFFRDVPWELQDAVNIDGGGIITFAVRVLVPISAPVVTTVTIITLIMSWNQFLLPLIVLSDQAMFTIPLGVMQFQGQFTTGWNYIMAFITLAIVPMLLLYIFLQRYIVAGLTAGATKG